MKRIAFIISHPIQYYVPLFSGLSKNTSLDIKVFYTWGEYSVKKFDPSYLQVIEWDIPLLEGYSHEFLENVSKDPGTHHFKGIDNPNIIESINQFAPDKIVVYGWSFKSHLNVLRYFKGKIPIYFRGDSHILNNKINLKSIVRQLFLTWVYKHIDYAISVGTNNRNYYKWLGLNDENILFAPHAIDNNKFEEIDRNKVVTLKNKLNIPDDHIVFIYCGSFEDRKRILDLIYAKSMLKNHRCSLIIVGSGKNELEIRRLTEQLNDKEIIFTGFINQSELPFYYGIADVFVLPSEIETWGLVINEAMAAGLAIITSDKVGAANNLVAENGFQYKCGDINDLHEKMLRLIIDESLLINCKMNSKLIIKDWSMAVQIEKFIEILSRK